MISSELADCGGGKRQPAAADGSGGGGGGVERSDDTGSRVEICHSIELTSGLVGNRQVEAGPPPPPPTQRRKRSNEPSKRNREKQRKPTMAEATVATAGDPEMEQRLEELTKENNALKNQLDEQIRLNSVIVANPTMASSKTLPEGTLPSALPYELLERNSKHIERNVEPPAVEFCPFPSLMSERSAFSVIRSSEPTAEPPGMPPPPFGQQQQQQAASAAASSLYPPPPNFFHFPSESSSQQLEFIRLAAQLSPFSLFSPSHFLPCSTAATTTTTLGFEQQQQQHLDLLDQLYRMPYQQHLQRMDSAEAAQQQRMAALSQPLTLDLPQQLANIRRKGIGIGVAGSNDGCQFSIQEPSTSNRSANGTEKFAFNISSNSSQSVIVDSGGWDAKKAMKATTSSRATASTDEGQPSSSEKKQRQHRMAAQTSVITAAVAMPDQSISSSMEMQQTQPDSSTITLPLSSANGMDQPKAAELMPDAAASSSSFLIADGQPPLIFPERKTVLEMATEQVGGYIPSAAAGGGLLAHSAASALLPSFPSSTSTALPLFNPFAHLFLLREQQQQQQQLNAAAAGMLEVMPSSSSASESAAEKAATQRNGTEKERNAPTEHQAKREKRLKAADGNGADGNGDGTSSSTRKTTVGPSSSSLASCSSIAASSTSALGSLLAAPSKRRTSPTVPASRTELCSGLATTTTVIDSHGQQAEAGRTAAANEKEQASERDRLKQQQQQQQREKEKAAAASSDSEQSTTGTGGQHSPNSMDSLLHSTSNSMSPSSTLPGAGSTMTTICGSDRTRRSSSSPSGNSGCSGDDSLADPFLLIDNGGKGPAEAGTSAQKRPKTASGGGCGSHSSAGANGMDRQSPAAGGSMRLKLRTSEDLERYMDRRRRNNEAAKRCRANRRAVFEFRSRRAQLLEAENGELRQEMLKLNSELDQLKAIIAANAAAAQQTHRLMPNI